MVVAVAVARVMQMPVDHEVDVVSVRKRVMSAANAMFVVDRVSTARVRRRTGVGVRLAYRDGVLVDVAFVGVMKVAVVSIVLVPSMADHRVTATGAVGVRMNLVRLVRAHGPRLQAKTAPERQRSPEESPARALRAEQWLGAYPSNCPMTYPCDSLSFRPEKPVSFAGRRSPRFAAWRFLGPMLLVLFLPLPIENQKGFAAVGSARASSVWCSAAQAQPATSRWSLLAAPVPIKKVGTTNGGSRSKHRGRSPPRDALRQATDPPNSAGMNGAAEGDRPVSRARRDFRAATACRDGRQARGDARRRDVSRWLELAWKPTELAMNGPSKPAERSARLQGGGFPPGDLVRRAV